MKYTEVGFEKKVSDNNYGSLTYSVKALCEDGDSIDEVIKEVTNRVNEALGLKPVEKVAPVTTKETSPEPSQEVKEEKKATKKKVVKKALAKKVVEEEVVEEEVPPINIIPYNRELKAHTQEFTKVAKELFTGGKSFGEMPAEFKAKIKEVSLNMEKDEVAMYADGELLGNFAGVMLNYFNETDV